ncbi:MAG: RNA polymerase factor sigma-54 [Bacteroidales bacterium OttesenSCG-928-I14]|jgi:RNA polymerase sigma-54 factor|nr:RNA polymerase factor sigma-54 [Bacteroidales bacterium OttesenSCG-928-I14]
MIKQQLSYKQQQKFSPQQIQQTKLLELTTLEVENRINEELEENPVLEEIPEPDEYGSQIERLNKSDTFLGGSLREDNVHSYKFQQNGSLNRWEMVYAEPESFHEYLLNQLKLKELSEEEIKIGQYIIGNMDDNGYIRQSFQTLSDDISFQYGHDVSISEIKKVLESIQGLDPPGIGAGDLQECLLLQLRRKKITPIRCLVIDILEKHFAIFAKKHYDSLCKIYNISKENLKDVIREVALLNPKPGNICESSMESKLAHIIPDFIVEIIDGKLIFTMAKRNMPTLKVNEGYSEILSNNVGNKSLKKREVVAFVKKKINSAQWFIDAIKQRNTTLYNTMLAIIKLQQDFFLTGEEQALKPMKLKDVSQLCGYDISTVSRATINKYIQSDWGIYPLRFFFSEAMINEEGEEISTREIKAILKFFIKTEDKKNPFTDDVLANLLKKKGYNIARRTVAKYREQLNIPVSRLRKGVG